MSKMSAAVPARYPGDCDQAFPEVFTVPPPQPTEAKPGQLTPTQVKQFFKEGYVLVENFFSKEELDPCRDAAAQLVDQLAQKLYKAGKIKNMYEDKGVFKRLTFIEEEFPEATVLILKNTTLPPAFRDLWTNERLLNAIEHLIGPKIAASPMYSIRGMTPRNEATTVPWHQDSGYSDNDSYSVLIAAAWIPLIDATEENGCMEMACGGHRTGRVARHTCCWRDTWYINLPEEEMEKTLGVDMKKDLKICPVTYGGMLLLNNLIPHRSLPNLSQDIRWSVDLRWQDPSKPAGFYGLKPTILLRDDSNPDHKIDWDSFNAINQNYESEKLWKKVDKGEDEFDTTIQGPWMLKWEMTHKNRHTEKLAQSQALARVH